MCLCGIAHGEHAFGKQGHLASPHKVDPHAKPVSIPEWPAEGVKRAVYALFHREWGLLQTGKMLAK
jgi:hypothetical protein